MEKSDILEAVNKFGSPLYVFDLGVLKTQVNMIKRITAQNVSVCFAMKANPFLVKPLKNDVDKFEVCSPGEYEICHELNVDPCKIVVSGVNKTMESMERIIKLGTGKGLFTIESMEHYEILHKICSNEKIKLPVVIRLTGGNQFGVDTDEFEKIALKCKNDEFLELKGLHFYSGTQKKLKKIEKELRMLDEYAGFLKEKHDIILTELEYGPGLSVNYFENETEPDPVEEVKSLNELLLQIENFGHITLEFGRFIASGCGTYITKIVDIKKNNGYNYCIVDGGIHHLNYYGQIMGMKKPFMTHIAKISGDNREFFNICGSLCTSNDILVKERELNNASKDDIIAFHRCGAYSVTEGMSLFLSRRMPQIVTYDDVDFKSIRDAVETYKINLNMEE